MLSFVVKIIRARSSWGNYINMCKFHRFSKAFVIFIILKSLSIKYVIDVNCDVRRSLFIPPTKTNQMSDLGVQLQGPFKPSKWSSNIFFNFWFKHGVTLAMLKRFSYFKEVLSMCHLWFWLEGRCSSKIYWPNNYNSTIPVYPRKPNICIYASRNSHQTTT